MPAVVPAADEFNGLAQSHFGLHAKVEQLAADLAATRLALDQGLAALGQLGQQLQQLAEEQRATAASAAAAEPAGPGVPADTTTTTAGKA